MNKLKYLYGASFIFWLATSLIAPFLAVFAINEVPGVGITEFGIATLIYYVSFGLSVMLIGMESDRMRGLKDEFEFTMIGFLSRGILFILFAFILNVYHLYMIHLFLGLSRGFSDGVKEKIQLKLTSRGLISTSFSLKDGIVNIAAAIGAGVGGYATDLYGFRTVMIFTGILTLLSGLVFSFSVKYLKKDFR
jgi:predicted MFS family arabinose efflux permease